MRISNSVQKRQQAKNQKGFKITMVRDVVYSSLFWPAVEEIRNWIIGREYRYYSSCSIYVIGVYVRELFVSLTPHSRPYPLLPTSPEGKVR